MDPSNLRKPKGSTHSKKRIGRGQGSGQRKDGRPRATRARSRAPGFKHKRGFEGGQMPLHRRVPKRGFHNLFRKEYEVVNLDTLQERFEAGVEVTPGTAARARRGQPAREPIKVLGARRHRRRR